jgi:hypothetical protein
MMRKKDAKKKRNKQKDKVDQATETAQCIV